LAERMTPLLGSSVGQGWEKSATKMNFCKSPTKKRKS
jgi:hypothetical protein